jgi:hypothetical protein
LNGWNLAVTQVEAYTATLRLAAREITEDEFAAGIRSHLAPWTRQR